MAQSTNIAYCVDNPSKNEKQRAGPILITVHDDGHNGTLAFISGDGVTMMDDKSDGVRDALDLRDNERGFC